MPRHLPDAIIAGRKVQLTDLGKVRSNKNWRFYSLMQVRFVDTGETLRMPSGQFGKWATDLEREAKRPSDP